MPTQPRDAVDKWREFANSWMVTWQGHRRSWADHITGAGFADEITLVQPSVFPAFASTLLGWTLNDNLFAEESSAEGRPDFRPDDQVTHKFVFETKGTNAGTALDGADAQVTRYLTVGSERIERVVLTNLVGLRVLTLNGGRLTDHQPPIDLRGLLRGPLETVATTGDARRLAQFIDDYERRELTSADKIDRVRNTPPWDPMTDTTSGDWVLARLDRAVQRLTTNVNAQISTGALSDTSNVSTGEQAKIVEELRQLASRLGVEDTTNLTLESFTNAATNSLPEKALAQYASHVAYYTATRITLVRVWEDLGLLKGMLFNGGFKDAMTTYNGIIGDIVRQAFNKASDRYRALFAQSNNYTWFTPSEDTYADTIYELANTYLGAVESDVLGQVYERMLERIDRKLLGVYYTPRDIIHLIWDLIGFDDIAADAEAAGRAPRIFDIATGSGGFLVEAGRRERERLARQRADGASVNVQRWLNDAADGLNGVEYTPFSAYLAELNLLVQFGQVIAEDHDLRLPPMGIICGDTLSLHEPDSNALFETHAPAPPDLLHVTANDQARVTKLKDTVGQDYLMDVACGNPPYIGEKTAAPIMRRTRERYPYWESFIGEHMDYLYWFLIAGVSKLRPGGRFGFITTEYWLRAAGARPLRAYLAERCQIDHIILFRDFRLFPDALASIFRDLAVWGLIGGLGRRRGFDCAVGVGQA